MFNPTVLDQRNEISKIDIDNMLGICTKTPDFCRDAITRAAKVKIPYKSPRNIIVVGMGGSAIGGDLVKDWLSDRASIPIEVCRDYVVPAYANKNSVVVAVSYSGETEETLTAFFDAVNRGCMVIAVSSGGHLQAFSRKLEIPFISIPPGFPPRAAIAYTFFSLVALMEKVHVFEAASGEVEETLRVLQKVRDANRLEVPLRKNTAKKLAHEIQGTIPVVYGFRQYRAVARRLKCQFNENSKAPSKFDSFPELNHNEIVGWEAPKSLTTPFSVILLRDPEEPPPLKNRIEITKKILLPKACKVLEITAVGKHNLAKMLSAMYIGDFASIYLALLRGVDPTPTKTISRLKLEMKRKLDMTTKFEEEMKRVK